MSLKCPDCGAPLSKDHTKCEFCGTELVLVQDGSAFQTRQIVSCPKCSSQIGSGSWFCVKCGYVLPEHRARILELQKKQRFLQQDVRRADPNLAKALEPGEFLYFTTGSKGMFYAATENRLLIQSKKKPLQQYPWSEVVAVGEVLPRYSWGTAIGYQFEVQTFRGPEIFQFPELALSEAFRFHSEVVVALALHNSGEKDVRQVIISLNVDEPVQTSGSGV